MISLELEELSGYYPLLVEKREIEGGSLRSITRGERDGVVKSDCLRARNSGVTIYLWNKPNTFTSDRIESKKMEIFFDYLPCRIRCSIFAYQFSLWNGSNPKKTSHYFRRSNVEKRRTISYKNVLEKKKKKKKKVFFLRVFILLLSPLILLKYISKLMKRAGWTPGFPRILAGITHSFPLYLRADLPVKLGRRRRRRDLNPLSTARDLCRNRDEKKSPSTLVTCNESISKFGSNGKFETTGVTRADRVEILDIKVVSQRWFYRDDKALVHLSIHPFPGTRGD